MRPLLSFHYITFTVCTSASKSLLPDENIGVGAIPRYITILVNWIIYADQS